MPKYRKPNDLNANTNCVLDHKYEYLADTIVSLCTARQTEAAEIALVAMRIRERIYRMYHQHHHHHHRLRRRHHYGHRQRHSRQRRRCRCRCRSRGRGSGCGRGH